MPTTLARPDRTVTALLGQLEDDHARVRYYYKLYQRRSREEGPERCADIVTEVLDELTVHAALEDEFVYPAARGAVEDRLLDAAEVEHEAIHREIDTLRGMLPSDDKYAARFIVLCEFVLHHIEQEEGEVFPQFMAAALDWDELARQLDDRRAGLIHELDTEVDLESGPNEARPPGPPPGRAPREQSRGAG